MSNYTPGRWYRKGGIITDASGEIVLADARLQSNEKALELGYVRGVASVEEVRANAILFAAAPRLKEALEAVMSNLGVPGPDYPAPVAEAYRIAAEALKGVE